MSSINAQISLIASVGLVLLAACVNPASNTASSPAASPAPSQPAATRSPAPSSPATSPASSPAANTTTNAKTGKTHSHGGQGGQVIESGVYHLELVTGKEADGTYINFFLQKGDNHEPIPDAKVTAKVQLPDGSQQSLDMTYDADGKHYVAILPGTAAGEYKVVILSDIKGEKVNGRFSFQR